MDVVSETHFESQILSQCQDFCRSVQIKKKNMYKKSSYYICLNMIMIKNKTFIAPFLEALTSSVSEKEQKRLKVKQGHILPF